MQRLFWKKAAAAAPVAALEEEENYADLGPIASRWMEQRHQEEENGSEFFPFGHPSENQLQSPFVARPAAFNNNKKDMRVLYDKEVGIQEGTIQLGKPRIERKNTMQNEVFFIRASSTPRPPVQGMN